MLVILPGGRAEERAAPGLARAAPADDGAHRGERHQGREEQVRLRGQPLTFTWRSKWILHRIWKYYMCCLRNVLLRIERYLSNNI